MKSLVKEKLIAFSNWFTLIRLGKIFLVATILNMIFTGLLMTNIARVQADGRQNGKNIKSIVQTVEHYTSPEQQKKNQENLNKFADTVILTINCDQQENNQRVIDVFVKKGYLSQEDADLLTQECKENNSSIIVPNDGN